MKKILITVFIISMATTCGKKGKMEYPGGQKIPNFDKVYDNGNL